MSRNNPYVAINASLPVNKEGKWTKYGGAVYGVVREKIVDEWFCQLCGESSPKELQPFLLEIFTDEYIRICNKCAAKKIKFVKRKTIIIQH